MPAAGAEAAAEAEAPGAEEIVEGQGMVPGLLQVIHLLGKSILEACIDRINGLRPGATVLGMDLVIEQTGDSIRSVLASHREQEPRGEQGRYERYRGSEGDGDQRKSVHREAPVDSPRTVS